MKLGKFFILILSLVTASAWGGAALFVQSSGAIDPDTHFDSEVSRLSGSILYSNSFDSGTDVTDFTSDSDWSYDGAEGAAKFVIPSGTVNLGTSEQSWANVTSGEVWCQWENKAQSDFNLTDGDINTYKAWVYRKENSDPRVLELRMHLGNTATQGSPGRHSSGSVADMTFRAYDVPGTSSDCGLQPLCQLESSLENSQPGGDAFQDRAHGDYTSADHLEGGATDDPFLMLSDTWMRMTMALKLTQTTEAGDTYEVKAWYSDENNCPRLILGDTARTDDWFLLGQIGTPANGGVNAFRVQHNSSQELAPTQDRTSHMRNLICASAEINLGTGGCGIVGQH